MTFLLYIRISDFQSHLDRHMTKNDEMTHAYIEDSDKPGHLCPWNLGYLASHWVHSKNSDRLGGCPADLSLRWMHN